MLANETTKQEKRSVVEDIDKIRRIKSEDKSKIARCKMSAEVSMSHMKRKQRSFLKEQMAMEEILDKTSYNQVPSWVNEAQNKEKNVKKRENLTEEMTKWYSTARTTKQR